MVVGVLARTTTTSQRELGSTVHPEAEQVKLEPQSTHASPPPPHAAVESPARHVSPLQHPSHESAHDEATQTAALHSSLPQSTQLSPSTPHAAVSEPTWHTPSASQQPRQLSSQEGTHVPSTHVSATSHAPHIKPPLPQADGASPARHSSSLQHPAQLI